MSQTSPAPPPAPTPRQLLVLSVPAVIIGVLSALILSALNQVAGLIEHATLGSRPDGAGGGRIAGGTPSDRRRA